MLPDVPVRQWVLSLPYRLRYLLAWDHDLCRAVVGVYVRAVLGFLRARARHNGVADGRSGAVVIIQRFGGALNLNVHLHALVIDAEGQVWITLRHQWSNGTTHLRFDPVALLERLAVLIPRPRINLVLYYGLLAPRGPWRAAVVASAGSEWSDAAAAGLVADEGNDSAGRRRPRGYLWAELMRRTFEIDVLDCPHCGGRLRLLALIEHGCTVERVLRHLGLPTERPEPCPAAVRR